MLGVCNFDYRDDCVDTSAEARTKRQQQSCLGSRRLSEGESAPVQLVEDQSVYEERVGVNKDILDGEKRFAYRF